MADDPKGFEPKYDDQKETGVILVGKSKSNTDGSSYRKVELILDEEETYLSERNAESTASLVEFVVRDRVTLFKTEGGQQKYQCWLMESVHGKSVNALHISRRTGKGVYGSHEVTLGFEAMFALHKYLDKLFSYDSPQRLRIPIVQPQREPADLLLSESQFIELIKANIRSTDDFYKLIQIQKMELAVARLESILYGDFENEVDIQKFLKENIWMFGNDYVHIVEHGKINARNILDMIPQDYESYIDIIEVKLPTEKLFHFDESHKNYYCSSKLTKATAQTQNYIYELEGISQSEEYQHNNNCKIVRPKGIILFGSEAPLNEDEKRYLRILNSSYHNMQIITYRQLLEKAKNTLAILKSKDK